MSSSFIPNNAFLQAITSAARRKPYPYVKDDEEIPLDGMQQVQAQSNAPRELPLAVTYAKDADQSPAIQPEIPLQQATGLQPLSREQEIDLAPIPEHDKTREGYQSLYNAGVPKPQMPDHSAEHHGFWGNAWQHLKHAGKGAAIGALLGSRAGGGGAIGGALLGGLTGGISPRAADTMEYNTFTEPKWEHDNEIAQQDAGRKAGIAKSYEQEFGSSLFDPNKQTEAAHVREEGAKDRRQRQDELQYNKGRDYDFKNKKFDADSQYKQQHLSLFKQKIEQGQTVKTVGADGNTYIVDKTDPTNAIMVTRKDGTPVGSWDEQVEEGRKYRFDKQQAGVESRFTRSEAGKDRRVGAARQGNSVAMRREAVSAIREHENLKAQAVKYQNDATRLDSLAESAAKDADREKYKADAKEARDNSDYYRERANRRAEEAATDYPGLVEHGTDKSGYDYGKLIPQPSANTSTAPRTAPKAPPRLSTPPQGGKIPRSVYDGMVADPKSGGKAAVDAWMQKNKLTFQD